MKLIKNYSRKEEALLVYQIPFANLKNYFGLNILRTKFILLVAKKHFKFVKNTHSPLALDPQTISHLVTFKDKGQTFIFTRLT